MGDNKVQTLEECITYYGRSKLVAITSLRQIFFYVTRKCQPVYVTEYENKLSCWFLKEETAAVYKEWLASNPPKTTMR